MATHNQYFKIIERVRIIFEITCNDTRNLVWQHVPSWTQNFHQKYSIRPFLVAQWLRIHLPMQGTRVRSQVWEDPTCRGATKPLHHNYWVHAPQLVKPTRLEPVLHNKRSHRSEKPCTTNNTDPMQPNFFLKYKKKILAMYLGFIKFTVEKDMHALTQVVPKPKSVLITELNFSF